eukprot:gene28648-35542_t
MVVVPLGMLMSIILFLAVLKSLTCKEIITKGQTPKFAEIGVPLEKAIKEQPELIPYISSFETPKVFKASDVHLAFHVEMEDVVTHVPYIEIQTLLDLYWSTVYNFYNDWYFGGNGHGIPWPTRDPYSYQPLFTPTAGMNPCADNWYGVTCDCDYPLGISPIAFDYYSTYDYGYTNSVADYSFNTTCHITKLILENVAIYHQLPTTFANLEHLTALNLGYNWLSGYFPTVLFGLPNLKHLTLAKVANIVGSIPSEIGDYLPNLELLNLGGTSLSGAFPQSISKMVNMKQLVLTNLQLTGSFPSEIFGFPYLSVLTLDNNDLYGTISNNVNQRGLMRDFRLKNNKFSGTIPD